MDAPNLGPAESSRRTDRLAATPNERKVLILPGTIVETTSWLRMRLTASDELVERGVPGFQSAMRAAVEAR